jgi:2-C-methyl-D-erythritol 4-phosphate cytidylyltransferase
VSVAAVIVAGGRGTRFQSDVPKQFLPLCGKAVVWYSIGALDKVECIESIVVVCEAAFCTTLRPQVVEQQLRNSITIVPGGARRQDSVYAGLQAVRKGVEIVVIHDAVRPFPPRDAVIRAIEAAREHGAAILAIPVSDTLKECDTEGFIVSTVSRESIWRAQTPQAFRADLIMRAYERIMTEGKTITDDAAAYEVIGGRVKIVCGSYDNIKITEPQDMTRAEEILRRGHEGLSAGYPDWTGH